MGNTRLSEHTLLGMAMSKKQARRSKKAAQEPSKAGIVSTAHITAAPWNPRVIDEQARRLLSESIHEFGDLSGIVISKDGTLVAGHQRLAVIRERWGDLPVKAGTIELPTGERVRVRVVDWEEARCKAASIAANNQAAAGRFTSNALDLVSDIEDVLPDLVDRLGLDLIDVGGEDDDGDAGSEPETGAVIDAIELQAFEHYDYLVILADNMIDWAAICELVGMKRVNSSPVGKKKVGLGRAIKASTLLKAIAAKE